MKRNRLFNRIVTGVAAALAVGALTSAVHATELAVIVHHVDGTYNMVSVPPATGCEPLDRLFPGSAGAAKTLRNLSTSNPAVLTDVFFVCKFDLYEGAAESCTAFKASGCQCTSGCNQLFLP